MLSVARLNPNLSWYVARASGLVAWALLATTVLWGLFFAGRLTGKVPPAWNLDLHRFRFVTRTLAAGSRLRLTIRNAYSLLLAKNTHTGGAGTDSTPAAMFVQSTSVAIRSIQA